jgi:hypothetical protein
MSVFAVSKVRIDSDGDVTDVLWGVVDTKSNHWVTPEVIAPVSEVVAALRNGDLVAALFPSPLGHVPGRFFVVVDDDTGTGTLAFDGPPKTERGVFDMDKLDP